MLEIGDLQSEAEVGMLEQLLPSRCHSLPCAKGCGSVAWAPSPLAIPGSTPRLRAEASSGHQEWSRRLWDTNAWPGTFTSSPPASIYGPALSEPITLGSQVTHWGGNGAGGGDGGAAVYF